MHCPGAILEDGSCTCPRERPYMSNDYNACVSQCVDYSIPNKYNMCISDYCDDLKPFFGTSANSYKCTQNCNSGSKIFVEDSNRYMCASS